MKHLEEVRKRANEARIAANMLEMALLQLSNNQCRRLGIDTMAHTLGLYLIGDASQNNLCAIKAWLDEQQSDWCLESEFFDEVELENRLEAEIRRSIPSHLQGD